MNKNCHCEWAIAKCGNLIPKNHIFLKTLKKLIPNLEKKDLNSLIDKKILIQEQDGRYELYHTKNSAGIDGIYRIFLPQSEIFSTITATENRDYIATTSISGKNKEEYKKKIHRANLFKE